MTSFIIVLFIVGVAASCAALFMIISVIDALEIKRRGDHETRDHR
jgi:hypothetical protein